MKVYQYPALKDNYNWILICEESNKCAGIDIYDSQTFINYVNENNLEPISILNTHHHNDHTGGNVEIKNKFPDIKFYGSKYDMEHNRIECQTNFVCEGDKIQIGNIELSVIDIVGHTLGHICYFNKEIAFVGDTLFASGCGRLFEGTYKQMFDSFDKIVNNLSLNTTIYCGHEYTLDNLKFCTSLNEEYFKHYFKEIKELRNQNKMTVPTNLEKELIFNPFLMVKNKDLRETLGLSNYNSLEAFTILREKKNSF
jgi:hydroxyacylglutathione hydrolase